MKIVINKCFGGFGLSDQAIMHYAKLKKIELYIDTKSSNEWCTHYYTDPSFKDKYYFSDNDIARDDPDLIETVQKLKDKANGNHAQLKVVEVPDGVDWEISDYDGIESIHQKHQSWG